MALVKVLGRDNVFFNTESGDIFNSELGGAGYCALLGWSKEDLYTLSERLGHPTVKIEWEFSTDSSTWSTWLADKDAKPGEGKISTSSYKKTLVTAQLVMEGPLWDIVPKDSILEEMKIKAYEMAAPLIKEQEENKRKAQEAKDLLYSLLSPGNQVTVVSFQEEEYGAWSDNDKQAELVLSVGDYEVFIKPLGGDYSQDFDIKVKKVGEK